MEYTIDDYENLWSKPCTQKWSKNQKLCGTQTEESQMVFNSGATLIAEIKWRNRDQTIFKREMIEMKTKIGKLNSFWEMVKDGETPQEIESIWGSIATTNFDNRFASFVQYMCVCSRSWCFVMCLVRHLTNLLFFKSSSFFNSLSFLYSSLKLNSVLCCIKHKTIFASP